jgi:hypothetical protein
VGLAGLVATVWMKARFGTFMTGNPLLLLSAPLDLVGVQFISLGLLGEVLTRTYFESQGKTVYAVRATKGPGTIHESRPLLRPAKPGRVLLRKHKKAVSKKRCQICCHHQTVLTPLFAGS